MEDINPGVFVIEYVGEVCGGPIPCAALAQQSHRIRLLFKVISHETCMNRLDEAKKNKQTNFYMLTLDSDEVQRE